MLMMKYLLGRIETASALEKILIEQVVLSDITINIEHELLNIAATKLKTVDYFIFRANHKISDSHGVFCRMMEFYTMC